MPFLALHLKSFFLAQILTLMLAYFIRDIDYVLMCQQIQILTLLMNLETISCPLARSQAYQILKTESGRWR